MLFRPPGRPSCKPLVRFKSFHYQAKSWTTPRRIVTKVEHHQGELFPRVGFIVTNMALPSRSVVRFYNKRGTAEQWIKEGKQATHWTRLSCHRFRANEVRLQLSVLAYNLGNLWRRLILPPRITRWSLTSLQQRLVKTGGRLVKHARYYGGFATATPQRACLLRTLNAGPTRRRCPTSVRASSMTPGPSAQPLGRGSAHVRGCANRPAGATPFRDSPQCLIQAGRGKRGGCARDPGIRGQTRCRGAESNCRHRDFQTSQHLIRFPRKVEQTSVFIGDVCDPFVGWSWLKLPQTGT